VRAPEQLGPYLLRQSDHCFPLGRDTLLLGAFATLRRGWRVCDLGCGGGALPLLLLRDLLRKGIQPDPARAQGRIDVLCAENIMGYGL